PLQASVAFESPKLRSGRLRVSVDLPQGAQTKDAPSDVLAVDDVAYAVLRERGKVRVLLVSDGNPFLERALEQDLFVLKDSDGHVPRLAPASFLPEDARVAGFDLVILDRVPLEGKNLAPGNYL